MQKLNIYIVPNNKLELIKAINNNQLSNNKFYTISELKNELYYSYDKQAVFYLMEKYQINYQVAKIYLDNLYYIDNDKYNSSKLNHLYQIKKDLINSRIITHNDLFIDFLSQSKIIFYGNFIISDLPKIQKDLLNITSIETIKDSSDIEYAHQIIACSTLEREVIYVAEKICHLIKSGIDINKIFITNLNNDYYNCIKRIFPLFNLPVNLNEKNTIYGTTLAKEVIANLANPIAILDQTNDELTEKLVNIFNDYAWTSDYKKVQPLIIDDMKHTYFTNEKSKNAINEIDFYNRQIKDDEYVFLLGFNQNQIPIIHKNENYLNDQELSELGLLASTELNKLERKHTINKIKSIKNLFITYKEKSLNESFYLSSLNDELNYPVIPMPKLVFDSSHVFNKLYLTSLLDQYLKYGTDSQELYDLNTSYPNLPYLNYNNQFNGLNPDTLKEHYKDGLTLSYSSMDNYYRCNFRYYLANILNLNIYEDTFMQTIGNIFHEVLEQSFINDTNFEILWENAINHEPKEYSSKEKFFLTKLKTELEYIIKTIEKQNGLSLLTQELHEKRVVIEYPKSIKVQFKGFIDKIKYQEYGEETIVAIIDYKTGNPNLNLNNCYYGLEMQLPVYLFLAKHIPQLKNIKIAGFYLQKILNNEIIKDNTHTYEEQKAKNLLLQGYSNENIEILSQFDPTYNNSSIVKSLKTSSKGFYAYSKVLNEQTIDKLIELVSLKIDEAIDSIINGKFMINPKQVGKVNMGCEFCKFKDICFMQEKNLIKLKEYKNLEFLERGESDAQMD